MTLLFQSVAIAASLQKYDNLIDRPLYIEAVMVCAAPPALAGLAFSGVFCYYRPHDSNENVMRCPHCLNHFHDVFGEQHIAEIKGLDWLVLHCVCPACSGLIVFLRSRDAQFPELNVKTRIVFPRGVSRQPLAHEVPKEYGDDYNEAALILDDSPKASAALSRRCLQKLIREKANIKEQTLYLEIEKLIASKAIPAPIAEQLHAVREVGNFAAHPLKDTNSGEIVDVEPGEAEWMLNILESMFDLYFVQPALAKKRKDGINKKLAAANKKQIR